MFEVSYDKKRDCLVGSFTGTLDLKTIAQFAKAIAAAAQTHDCKRFLNDMRKAKVDFSTVELYRMPGVLDASGLDPSWRRAIIASKQLKDYRFFETVAQNQGYSVRVFTDPDEALTWLKADTPDP